MTTPRQIVADQFRADYEVSKGYKVYAFPYAPTEARKPVLAVWRTDMAPHPDTPNALRHSLLIQAYIGPTLEEKAEAALDDVLDDVMLSLQRIENLVFDSAERTVFGTEETGSFQGWAIKCHADSKNVYKSQILSESEGP